MDGTDLQILDSAPQRTYPLPEPKGVFRLAIPPQAPNPDRLRELDQKLARLKQGQEGEPPMEEHYSQAQVAWRMVTELVAGLGIGFGIGYGLDAVLGTTPWLMVLFIFLGFAAGVKTMMRTAQEVQNQAVQPPEDGSEPDGKRS